MSKRPILGDYYQKLVWGGLEYLVGGKKNFGAAKNCENCKKGGHMVVNQQKFPKAPERGQHKIYDFQKILQPPSHSKWSFPYSSTHAYISIIAWLIKSEHLLMNLTKTLRWLSIFKNHFILENHIRLTSQQC